jgi:hypothetical protein
VYPAIHSLPGMLPIPLPPGVTVHVQNIVSGPIPYAQPFPGPPAPQAAMVQTAGMPPAQARFGPKGVVDLMRADAASRTMEAVARGGPARILAYAIGGSALATATVILLAIPFGVGTGALILLPPLMLAALLAFWIGRRTGRGVSSHHLEQAILRYAADHEGQVRVVGLAQATGASLRECEVAIDAMVLAGHATVDADDHGALLYRVPDLAVPAARDHTVQARIAHDAGAQPGTATSQSTDPATAPSTINEDVVALRMHPPRAKGQ